MSRSVTLASLRTSIARRGGYENRRDIDSALLTEFANEALAELWDILVIKGDRYLSRVNKAYAANAEHADLPDDCYRLRKVEIKDGAQWRRMMPHDLDSAHTYNNSTVQDPSSYRYRLQNTQLWISPLPTSALSLRLYYVPFAPTLVNDADEIDAVNGYEELVIQLALYRCYKRQDQPTDETLREIERLKMRVSSAADGQDSQPFFLDPMGPDDDSNDGEVY
jgi:hypothetical protein